MSPDIELREFHARVREKLNLSGRYEIEIKDEMDKIAIVDKEDLDAAIETSKDAARISRSTIGKLEVCRKILIIIIKRATNGICLDLGI